LVSHNEEEYRLRVFENRVLRGIYGPKRKSCHEIGGNCVLRIDTLTNKFTYYDTIYDKY
jgi:hypothetical protein